jgi:acylphosphatase
VYDPRVATVRFRIRVDGAVQGVGFRPFVHGAARRLGLAGSIRNDGRGALIEVEGSRSSIDAFLDELEWRAPPLARIERIAREAIAPTGEREFAIAASEAHGPAARADLARRRDLRRVRRRDLRSRRAALPLRVHQLHELRPALHDRARRPLRPRDHDDERIRDVRRLRARVRRSARPPLPRAAVCCPGVRPAARASRRATASTSPATRSRAAAALIDGGCDRRDQGARRPSTSPRARSTRARSPRCAAASSARSGRSR